MQEGFFYKTEKDLDTKRFSLARYKMGRENEERKESLLVVF